MNKFNPILIPILLFMTCLSGQVTYAQQRQADSKPDEFHAVHLNKEDGSLINRLNVMFKDAEGFLWLGYPDSNSPIYRFDGAVFKSYIPEKNKKNGAINSGEVYSFKEDSLHNIWIGTEKGMSRYDIKADTFSNFSPLFDSLYDKATIAPFWATPDELYCIEPSSWITAIDVRTFKRRKLVKIPKEVSVQVGQWNTNKSIFEAASGSFWALAFYEGQQGFGLVQIFLNGNVVKYPWPCLRNHTGKQHGHGAEDMEFDPVRNSIWINSSDGLLEFSLRDKQFHPIAAMDDFVKRKDYDRGVGITIDQRNRIWFSTWSNGILTYDPKTNQVEPIFSDPDLQKKVGEFNLHIYIDPDGIGWVSNWLNGGIYELLPTNSVFKRYFANPSINYSLSNLEIWTILRGPKGKLWMGTQDGLNIFDPGTEKFGTLREKDLPGIKGKAIIPLHIDTIGQVAWLVAGSPDRDDRHFHMDMYEMDLKTMKCSPIIVKYGEKTIDPFSVQRAIVSPYKDGIVFSDDYHGVFEVKRGNHVATLLISFKPPQLFAGMVTVENRYVFLRSGGPLPNFTFENKNEKWEKIPHPLDSLNWSYVLYDSRDQTYWVCVKNEVLHFDKAFQKIRSYSSPIWEMEFITNLLFDNAGNLWFVNAKQIGRLNPVTGVITVFAETDGYKKQDYDWMAPGTKDAGGNIYFGGSISEMKKRYWGLDRIYPERFFQEKASQVYLDALSINQKPLSSPHRANNQEELSLRYNQNNISVEGGVIDYYSRGKSRLRYKLVGNGKEVDWQYGPSSFSLHYEGLAPGDYKLVMQASNADYEFFGPGKVLAFTIAAPLWDRTWFRILAVTLAILLLYGFFRYRSRNLRQRNAQLEEKVLSRTKELKHSLEELRDTQTQLVQREKMASLGELTAGIAHEIQNPLNFMNNFSEVNAELIDELNQELDKGNLDDARAISKDIKDNELKISHHGKRADAIVKGMLQHSRASTGVKEPTGINALADEYLRLSYHGLRAKDKSFNADIETHFDPGLGEINIVPQDMGRVLLNIYNNAFYAVHDKQKQLGDSFKPKIAVTTQFVSASNGTISQTEIRIRDNGMGIPKKVIDKIFQPFFTTKPTGEGTGLGLSLSYDIVTKMHGGKLDVETSEGEGTEFIVRLPI